MSLAYHQPPIGPLYNSSQFPDPFMDMASLAMPDSNISALRWCEYIFMANGTYRQAVDRILSYFITDIDIGDVPDEKRERWKNFLEKVIDIKHILHIAGLDAMCYGNSFVSVLPSFRRFLRCQRCSLEVPIREAYESNDFKFSWKDFKFHAHCPSCHYQGEWQRVDRDDTDQDKIKIKRWNPHEIEIIWDPLTDDTLYLWKIPEEYRQLIREGRIFHLERASWDVVEAVRDNGHLQFENGVLHHLKEDALAGLRNRGWGISRVLCNFRQAWYVQLLHRYNEAVALDYVIPFRVITPVPGNPAAGNDPLTHNLAGFTAHVSTMLRRRSRDPAAWHVLPYPISYQALGGDARVLAPRDLLDQGLETLLNSIGVPVELYRCTLQFQSAPTALRLFEASWSGLTTNLNNLLRFIVKRVASFLSWEEIDVRLARVTHAEDAQRQYARLQLMSGGQISQTTGLASVGIDFREEYRRMLEEQLFQAREQAKMQKTLEQASQAEQMAFQAIPPPGMPAGGGVPVQSMPQPSAGGAPIAGAQVPIMGQGMPNVPTTPEDLMQKAHALAVQLLGMGETQKDSELIKLKKLDPVLHAIVRAQMDDIRRQAQTQGGAMLLSQMFGKPV